MRALILFLILVNLAFYYWVNHYDSGHRVPDQPQSVAGYKPIQLLSERTANDGSSESQVEKTARTPQALPSQTSAADAKCYSLGPFAKEQKSDEIYEKLFTAGIQARQRQVNERRPKSYWVYLEARESQQEAEETVEFLSKNNITEYYIWLTPPQKYAVSLGLFKKLSTAREKMADIKALGLEPKMEVRFDEITEYWVDFDQENRRPQPEIIEQMLIENDRMLILETKCL